MLMNIDLSLNRVEVRKLVQGFISFVAKCCHRERFQV